MVYFNFNFSFLNGNRQIRFQHYLCKRYDFFFSLHILPVSLLCSTSHSISFSQSALQSFSTTLQQVFIFHSLNNCRHLYIVLYWKSWPSIPVLNYLSMQWYSLSTPVSLSIIFSHYSEKEISTGFCLLTLIAPNNWQIDDRFCKSPSDTLCYFISGTMKKQ